MDIQHPKHRTNNLNCPTSKSRTARPANGETVRLSAVRGGKPSEIRTLGPLITQDDPYFLLKGFGSFQHQFYTVDLVDFAGARIVIDC